MPIEQRTIDIQKDHFKRHITESWQLDRFGENTPENELSGSTIDILCNAFEQMLRGVVEGGDLFHKNWGDHKQRREAGKETELYQGYRAKVRAATPAANAVNALMNCPQILAQPQDKRRDLVQNL